MLKSHKSYEILQPFSKATYIKATFTNYGMHFVIRTRQKPHVLLIGVHANILKIFCELTNLKYLYAAQLKSCFNKSGFVVYLFIPALIYLF